MANTTMRVTTVERNPYSVFVRDEQGNIRGYKGYIFDLLDLFTATYNISYEVIVPPDNEFGVDLGNGTWTGMIGLLLTKQADMAAAFVTVTEERSAVVDFSMALSYEAMNVLQRHPHKAANPKALVAPFALQSWIAILTAVGVMSMGIHLFRYSENILYSNSSDPEPLLSEGVSQTVDFVLRTILNQGGDLSVRSTSCRLICYAWLLFAAIISCLYTANLTAFMAVLVYDVNIRSLDDIPRHADVKWLVRQGSAMSAAILKTSAPTDTKSPFIESLKRGYQRKRGTFIKDDQEAAMLVSTKGYIYIRERTVLQSLISRDVRRRRQCHYMMGQDGHMVSPEAFGFPRDSRYKQLFDNFTKSMEQFGHLIGIRRRHVDKAICSLTLRDDSNEDRPMSAADFTVTYVTLAIGCSASLLVLVIEIVISRRQAAARRWHLPGGRLGAIQLQQQRHQRRNVQLQRLGW